MLEILYKYKKVIFRSLGALMLLISFVAFFWSTPSKGLTKSQIAAANVARMEASVLRNSGSSGHSQKVNKAPLFKEYKNTKDKQLKYLTIIIMIVGAGFFVYSFIGQKK